MKSIFTGLLLLFSGLMYGQSSAEILRWKQYSKRTTIYRDSFGVPHIYGKKDADAVFGVRPSLIADFVHRPSGTAPDGKVMDRDFYTLDYDFVMVPA